MILCTFEIGSSDIVECRTEDTRGAAGVDGSDLACSWFADAAAGREPASWRLSKRLVHEGAAGLLAPSFVNGATAGDVNLILWRWSGSRPHMAQVHDPGGRLPKSQLSWD